MLKRLILAMALGVWMLSAAPQMLRAAEPVQTTVEGESMHDGAEHKKPPLLANPFSDPEARVQSIWVVVIFGVLLIVLYPTAWKNILIGLKAREDRIRKDIADAEAARIKGETSLKELNAQLAAAERRVQEMISKAVTEGEKLATSIKMSAQQEAEEAKERASRDIEAAKNAAIADIYTQAAELATNVAEKILRRSLNAADQKDLVDRSLEQLQGLNRN